MCFRLTKNTKMCNNTYKYLLKHCLLIVKTGHTSMSISWRPIKYIVVPSAYKLTAVLKKYKHIERVGDTSSDERRTDCRTVLVVRSDTCKLKYPGI